MTKIRFRINFEVKIKRKFEKFLAIYKREIEYDFQELKIEKYWKQENQFQAIFFIKTEFEEKEQIVYEILKYANKLCSTGNWSINGPHENEKLVFECILNNVNDDQPLKWAHIEIEGSL